MTKLLSVAGFAGLVLVAGCATQPLTKAQVDGKIVCNVEQMDQVERAARRNFVELHWINCPTATLRVL